MSRARKAKNLRVSPSDKRSTSARIWVFRIVSVVAIPVLLLVTIEAGLRIFGLLYPSEFTVPCTVQGRSATCDNPRFTWQFFPYGMARAPMFFTIPTEKQPGTFRIFVLGESAAQGDPEPSYSFSRYLEVMLRDRFPAGRFEVVNAGVVAINSHILLPIARDLTKREGDLFILYIGNNEVVGPYGAGTVLTSRSWNLPFIRASIFLRSTRIGQVIKHYLGRQREPMEWGGMEMFIKEQVPADAPALKRVYENFRTNLKDIIKVARRAGAHVLVSTVGTNLRDSAPFASLHSPDLIPERRSACEALCKAGLELERTGQWADALKRYLSAAEIDDRFAEAHFGAGRCYWHLGDEAAARERFVRARDLDALRFRADSTINEIVRSAASAAGPGVEIVDGEAALIGNGSHSIPGNDVFYDHVHLNPRGNYLLARALFPRVASMLPEEVRRSATTDETLSQKQCEQQLAFTGLDRRRVAQNVLRQLNRAPFTNQSNHNEQVAEMEREAAGSAEGAEIAGAVYRQAIARQPDDLWLHFNYGLFLAVIASDPAAAAEQFSATLELHPNQLRARDCLAEMLVKLGRLDEAVAQYRQMLDQVPYYANGRLNLVQTLYAQGRLDDAINEARRGDKVLLKYGDVRQAAVLRQKAQELADLQRQLDKNR
jgi:tetratricopeptide (TPR) repeat protein